jgi:hypothetical protein
MKVDFSKIAELLLDANVMIDLQNSENMQVAELLSKEVPCSIVEHTSELTSKFFHTPVFKVPKV